MLQTRYWEWRGHLGMYQVVRLMRHFVKSSFLLLIQGYCEIWYIYFGTCFVGLYTILVQKSHLCQINFSPPKGTFWDINYDTFQWDKKRVCQPYIDTVTIGKVCAKRKKYYGCNLIPQNVLNHLKSFRLLTESWFFLSRHFFLELLQEW